MKFKKEILLGLKKEKSIVYIWDVLYVSVCRLRAECFTPAWTENGSFQAAY